jgi:hypothetical protein
MELVGVHWLAIYRDSKRTVNQFTLRSYPNENRRTGPTWFICELLFGRMSPRFPSSNLKDVRQGQMFGGLV